jgi:transposase
VDDPGIDPVVYLKMLMVGFFENLPSERAIAARCEDSLSVRAFLGYGLEESTPDHSSLSVIRQRLGAEIYQGFSRSCSVRSKPTDFFGVDTWGSIPV